MASTLIGVGRRLTWDDFKEQQPPPEAPHAAAGAFMTRSVAGGAPKKIQHPGASAPIYFLADDITIRIELGDKTFRSPAVAKMAAGAKAELLAHEQGHYDLYALVLRDWFYELTTLTGRSYDDQAALVRLLSTLKASYLDRIGEIQQIYDSDTEHNFNSAEQKTWLRAIRRARKLKRQPIVEGKNGKPLERRLFDVLKEMELLV
ncbi:MAG: hypothetical protein JNK46_05950 [Methylobacteriaceae bacterium]|nr:hypothetical protein [Methylobacteriaceae bacterium]